MKKSELMSKFGDLKSRLSAIQAKLNTIDNKADLGGSKNTLREAYSKLNNDISTMTGTLKGYVDKGETSSYTTLAAFYAAKKTVAPETQTKDEGTTTQKKKRDSIEGNGGWTYKNFNPSMTGVKLAGTGVKVEFCGACIVLNGGSIFQGGVTVGCTIVNANSIAVGTEMTALKNAVKAAATAVQTVHTKCLSAAIETRLSCLDTGALRAETSALSTRFM